MEILKLFFEHDMRLDTLARRNANRSKEEVEATLQDFMKPTPTYSKFYITATDLERERFGINVLKEYRRLAAELDGALGAGEYRTWRFSAPALVNILEKAAVGEAILISPPADNAGEGGGSGKSPAVEDEALRSLNLEADSNVGHHKEELREILLGGRMVLYKEQAHNGFDLHLFSKKNIYPALFPALKNMIGEGTRLFSINSKRMRSERHFYFETWTLDRPPHGAEEVLPETEI